MYMSTLAPGDAKRDNALRTARRKVRRPSKTNTKDPNAPQKSFSAYSVFLQRVRSDPGLVKEVFGDETDLTRQTILAAAKWGSMTDNERKVHVHSP